MDHRARGVEAAPELWRTVDEGLIVVFRPGVAWGGDLERANQDLEARDIIALRLDNLDTYELAYSYSIEEDHALLHDD
jgi:hypothetical protein